MKTPSLTILVPISTLLLLVLTSATQAANQTVSNLGDTGLASQLRQKLATCQSGTSPGGTITFSVAGTVMLDPTKGPLPTITTNVTINGAGNVGINGQDGTRIFNVASGTTLTLKNITLSHAYSANGDGGAVASTGALNADNAKFLNNATSASWSGSAILCWGPLNIINCEFGFNSGGGGAVKPRSSGATTTITGSNFHDNSSTSSAGGGYGGAMQVFDGPAVTINESVFSNNTAQNGGAIYISTNSSLVVGASTFSGNSATGGGGAICNQSNTYLSGVTLSGNQADGGGGIYNNGVMVGSITYYSLVTLSNVTISGNRAGTGGGINNDKFGESRLTNVTISGNSATAGNGIYSYDASAATLTNTLIARGTSGANCLTSSGFVAGSFNLSDDNTCGFTAPGDPLQRDNVTDLLLGPLADNGGFTPTQLPQPGSRAIDNGTDIGAPDTDQRGIKRAQLAGIDVGAVEVVPPIFQDTDSTIQYDNWIGIRDPNASGGTLRFSSHSNDTVTYKFNATSIKWITAKGPNSGKALVTIDGVNKGTFDLYNATSLSNRQFLFSGLASAVHNIVVKVTGTKNASSSGYNVVMDGFLVGASTKVLQESAPAVQYDKWIGKTQALASGGSYRVNSSIGFATLSFAGTSVSFMTARGPSYGKVSVGIDGEFALTNLDLYAPTQQWQYKVGITDLVNGPHTIEIETTHTKNASSSGYGVVLDAIEAFRPQLQ